MVKKTFFQKSLSLVCVSFVLAFSLTGVTLVFPQKTHAQFVPVGDVVNFEFHAFEQFKEQGLDAVAWALAKEVINQMTADIIDWVEDGFDGEPAFVQNPLRLANDIADETALVVFDEVDQVVADAPFAANISNAIKRNYVNSYLDEPYDLDQYSSDPEAYLSGDFSKGGWDAWFATLENPNNTPVGAYLEAKTAQQNITNQAQGQEFLKLEWGDGWKSVEDEAGNTLTPGGIIEGQVEEVLSSGLNTLENADELNEVLSGVVGVLVNQVFSEAGLIGASQSQPGSNDVLTELLREAATQGSQEIDPLPTAPTGQSSGTSEN